MNEKSINNIYVWALLTAAIWLGAGGCSKHEDYNAPSGSDQRKPAPVTNVQVENFGGGAHITYTLPQSPNLLYVSAQYRINGHHVRETKSSYYTDTITVSGFADADAYEVTLHAVTRSEVKSDPVTVVVNPTTPPYRLVKPTLEMTPDFSGVRITGFNAQKNDIGIVFLARDPATNTLEIEDQYYTNNETIDFAVRGLVSEPRQFGVYVTDRFGNISDTLIQSITPLHELLLDKNRFFSYQMPSDGRIGYGWSLSNLWNGTPGGDGWHTEPGGRLPAIATFGIGQSAKLSRMIVWARAGEYAYGHGNPRLFSLWGSNTDAPKDATLPLSAPEGTVVGDWVNLGNFEFPPPPSGMPSTAITDADRAYVAGGVSFNVPISSPKAKFFRLSVSETWSKGDFAHLMELSLYGTNED